VKGFEISVSRGACQLRAEPVAQLVD